MDAAALAILVRLAVLGIAGQPHFLGGEHQHRRGVTHQRVKQQVEHGAIGVARVAVRPVAIEAVLADIEEERREVLVAEIDQQARVEVEVVGLRRRFQLAVEVPEQRENIDLQLGQRARIAHVADKPTQRAEQVAEGVAQLAILVAHALEDLVADAVILGVIDAQRPQADDVRAVGFHHLQWIDRVAEALGHLLALGIHREAVGEHLIIGRAAAGDASFEQRGLEPAAMLVRSFEVEVGGPCEVRPAPAFEHEGMGAAAIEPHVENVGDHLVVVGVVVRAEEGGFVGAVPRVHAFRVHACDDAGVH